MIDRNCCWCRWEIVKKTLNCVFPLNYVATDDRRKYFIIITLFVELAYFKNFPGSGIVFP